MKTNKKIATGIVACSLALCGGIICSSINQDKSLFNDNVEALSQCEGPSVSNCIWNPNYDCEAMHPTDPSRDQYREHAIWSNGYAMF